MSTETWITLIVTIAFGIPAYLALKKENGSIIFLEVKKIDLYNRKITSFENIIINYKNNEIKKTLFQLKGLLISIGKKDITKEVTKKPINLKLKEGLWREAKIISETMDLNAELTIAEEELFILTDLFKRHDYVYFEALGEADESTYSINHRIAHLGKIKVDKFESYIKPPPIYFYIGPLFFFLMILTTGVFTDLFSLKFSKSDMYLMKTSYYNQYRNEISYDSAGTIYSSDINLVKDSLHRISNENLLQFDSIQKDIDKFSLYMAVDGIKDSLIITKSKPNYLIPRKTKFVRVSKNIFVRFEIKGSYADLVFLLFILSGFSYILYLAIDLIKKLMRKRRIRKIVTNLELLE